VSTDEDYTVEKIETLLGIAETHLRYAVSIGAPPHGVEVPMDAQFKRAIIEAAADVLKAIKLSIVEVFREAEEAFEETDGERAGQVDRGQPDPDPVHGEAEL
jgi:hypothetical protein